MEECLITPSSNITSLFVAEVVWCWLKIEA